MSGYILQGQTAIPHRHTTKTKTTLIGGFLVLIYIVHLVVVDIVLGTVTHSRGAATE